MTAFNYRAYNLELDVCDQRHGFWLDEGEAKRVREIVEERVAGLERATKAEGDWDRFLGDLRKGPSFWDRLTGTLTVAGPKRQSSPSQPAADWTKRLVPSPSQSPVG